MTSTWHLITNLGSSSVLAPLVLLTALCLWHTHQWRLALIWLGSLGSGALITLATKLAFDGWGIGIKSVDFTGVSGHCFLATATFPVLFGWLAAMKGPRTKLAFAILGFALAGLVGYSRLMVEAHSWSEVIVGWILGTLVSLTTLAAMRGKTAVPWYAPLLPLVLLLSVNPTTSTYLPSRDFEVTLSLMLSGRDRPFTREDWRGR